MAQNPNSHLTAKERDKMSFPAKVLLDRGLLDGAVLDYGCGFGADVTALKRKGFDVDGYDPYYAATLPSRQYDTILCLYVLNVLFPEEQQSVIQKVAATLTPGGIAYFAVRRDIRHEGFRMHKLHQKPTFQCNVLLDLPSIFKNDFCEIYALQQPVVTAVEQSCPFCSITAERPTVAENRAAIAVYDKFPVSPGHVLVIPKVHVSNFLDLDMPVQQQCLFLVNYIRHKLEEEYKPDGFNIGINCGEAAGQTVMHAHIHIIPRYAGDLEEPRGGVRGVIPGRRGY